MKRCLFLLLITGMLLGCNKADDGISAAITLRNKLLQCTECTFETVITADYGEKIQTFSTKNKVDNTGKLEFEVVKPEEIEGITGEIAEGTGKLTFDDKVLLFELLADEQITPVCAPWIFISTLRGGYIRSCEVLEDGYRIQMDDSYEEDALQMDIWINEDYIPIRGEILFRGRRILTLDVETFQIV